MDFTFSKSEEAYRAEVRTWLTKNVPDWWKQADATEFGEEEDFFEKQRSWHQAMFDAGYIGITWPEEYAGQGRSHIENAILQEELVHAAAPPTVNGLGIGLCGPALIHHGTDAQRQRYLRPMLRAEEMWCQGYSEPGAGSDLAGLQTRAELQQSEYVVNGQKIWTSGAHHADWCFCLVRTDPDAPKHGGIGFLLIDMRSPGVEVQPLPQLTGNNSFSQVFFTDVHVPAENMVGKPTEGWRVANTVLGYERGAGALSRCLNYKRSLDHIVDLARETPRAASTASQDPIVRQRIADAAINVEILRLSSLRQLSKMAQGEKPGPESSIAKLYYSELEQKIAGLGNSLGGPFGQLLRRSPRSFDAGRYGQRELQSRAGTIYAGTSEIQRNIISERVLGLPRR